MAVRHAQLSNGRSPSGGLAHLGRWLLRLPLFYKILIANSAIVALGAIVGTIVTVWHVRAYPGSVHYELIALFAGAGFAISFAVNFLAIRLALDPLDRLQAAVDDARGGRMDVRVSLGRLSDERFDRLADAFNRTLDRLAQDSCQLHQLSQALLQAQEDERQRILFAHDRAHDRGGRHAVDAGGRRGAGERPCDVGGRPPGAARLTLGLALALVVLVPLVQRTLPGPLNQRCFTGGGRTRRGSW